MSKRSRPSFKKREREMAKKQKKQEKAERLAARRSGQEPDPAAPQAEEPDPPALDDTTLDR